MAVYRVDADLFGDGQEAGTLDDPSYKVINRALQELEASRGHYDKLADYYLGKQAVTKRQFKNSTGTKNVRVMVNHAKYITDMQVGFMMGNPIKYTAGNGKNIDAVLDEMDGMSIQKHDSELEKDLSTFGVGYELLYLDSVQESNSENQDDSQVEKLVQIKAEKIDPRAVVIVTDDTVEHNPLFAIYAQQKKDIDGLDDGYLISVYTKHYVISYRTHTNSMQLASNEDGRQEPEINYFGDVPIIEYRNNEERQGDFEQQISLIDAYNLIQSDRVSDKEAFVDAILIFYGFGIDDKDPETVQGLRTGFINFAPSKSEGASAEWLTKTLDENQVEVLKKSIEDDIHKTSYVPNMNDQNFMGNTSGEAMKYKLFGLLNVLGVKSQYYQEGLRKRLGLMQNVLKLRNQDCDVSGCKITITPNIPVNLSETISNIVSADGHIPREITYSWLPDVNDPQEIIDMMSSQNTESIKQQQQALTEGNADYIEGEGAGANENDSSTRNQEQEKEASNIDG